MVVSRHGHRQDGPGGPPALRPDARAEVRHLLRRLLQLRRPLLGLLLRHQGRRPAHPGRRLRARLPAAARGAAAGHPAAAGEDRRARTSADRYGRSPAARHARVAAAAGRRRDRCTPPRWSAPPPARTRRRRDDAVRAARRDVALAEWARRPARGPRRGLRLLRLAQRRGPDRRRRGARVRRRLPPDRHARPAPARCAAAAAHPRAATARPCRASPTCAPARPGTSARRTRCSASTSTASRTAPAWLRPLLLPDGFEGTRCASRSCSPRGSAKAWPGAKEPGEGRADAPPSAPAAGAPSRRKVAPPGVPDPSWGPR